MPHDTDPALAAALAGPFRRVMAVDLADGRKVWLKRVERLTGRMRLQKGDPQRAFRAEREALHHLAALNLPVVPVVAEGEGWFATADCGQTLNRALLAEVSAPARSAMMAAAGQALAALHGCGLAHGRPVLRDICWDGQTARFLDLERFNPATGRQGAMALDAAILVQSWFTDFAADPAGVAPLEAAFAAWKAAAPPGVLRRAGWLGWVLLPLMPLAWAVATLRPKAREFRALPLALAYLRRSAR